MAGRRPGVRWLAVAVVALLATLAGGGAGAPTPILVVMSFKRLGSLQRLLEALRDQGATAWPLVIVQSVTADGGRSAGLVRELVLKFAGRVIAEAPAGDAAALSQRMSDQGQDCVGDARAGGGAAQASWPCVVHATTPAAGGPGTTEHGSKLESSRNLLRGLSLASGSGSHVVVAEDDTILSPDAVSCLQAGIGRVMSGRRFVASGASTHESVGLMTLQALLRPGLFSDMGDWVDGSLADAVASAEARLRDGFGGPAAALQVRRVSERFVFKTYAWAATAAAARDVAALLTDQVAGSGARAATGTMATARDGIGHLGEWCASCDPLCYDHAIEAAMRGRLVVAPAVPRASTPVNRGLSGAISQSDSRRRAFAGPPVGEAEWQVRWEEGPREARGGAAELSWAAAWRGPQARLGDDRGSSPVMAALAAGPRGGAFVPLLHLHRMVLPGMRDPSVLLALAGAFAMLSAALLACNSRP